VTVTQLESRADRLFGREVDLTRLLQRTRRSGLTAIVGPPQIGKSWLLMELAYRLDREMKHTRSPKGATDPLLQVVSDLYQRWLANARDWEQLRAVWEQQFGAQEGGEAAELLRDLEAEYPGIVYVHTLGEMNAGCDSRAIAQARVSNREMCSSAAPATYGFIPACAATTARARKCLR
jgi:hypothetical protein